MMQSSGHIPYLDGWRGVAIGFLLVGHFFPVQALNLGAVGVNLFFVLSGLLMAQLLFIKRVELPTFYRRRVSRIMPTVFVFITAAVAWNALSGKPVSWSEVAAAATFTNNYFLGGPHPAHPFGHIWSLSVEEHSYVLLSILAVLARHGITTPARAVGFAVCAMIACTLLYGVQYSAAEFNDKFRLRSEVAAIGIFASAFLVLLWASKDKPNIGYAVPVLMVVGVLAYWWRVPVAMRVVIGCGAFALAVNMLDRAPRILHAVLEIGPLRQLGVWSFSLYIWQQPFYLMMNREELSPALALAMSLIVGVAAYYLIENPARLYLNRVWTGRKAAPVSSVQPLG